MRSRRLCAHARHDLGVEARPAAPAAVGGQRRGHAVERRVEQVRVLAVQRQPLGDGVAVGRLLAGAAAAAAPSPAWASSIASRFQAEPHRLWRSIEGCSAASAASCASAWPMRSRAPGQAAALPALALASARAWRARRFSHCSVALHRRAAVVGGHGAPVPLDGAVEGLDLAVGQAEGLGDRAHAAPQRGEARLEVADALELLRRLAALVAALDGQLLQRQRQAQRRGDALVLLQQRVAAAGLGVAGALAEHPVRVAIALVGGPGVAAVALAPGLLARRATALDEGPAGQQLAVELVAKTLGRLVLDRPAGGDDAAHAELDQRVGHAGGEGRAVHRRRRDHRRARQHLAVVARRQVAAVDEHQLGHGAHLPDLAGAEEGAVRHHQPAQPAGLAVAGDVHDAVVAREQRVQDRRRIAMLDHVHARGVRAPRGPRSVAVTSRASASAPGSGA